MSDLTEAEPHRHTMDRLEAAKRTTPGGTDYWRARELGPILGYPVWGKFEPVVHRAAAALVADGRDPSQQIAQTGKFVGREDSRDYFLTRAASYLVAMNGDPTKPEIAAAQIYFASRTRQKELEDQAVKDAKRLELRDKVSVSARKVSGAAREAGVNDKRQGIFHEQRYIGLYNASSSEVKRAKGLKDGENIMDRFGSLELSAHDFQMELAANVLAREGVRGENAAFKRNLQVAQHVRKTIQDSGGTPLEKLPLDEHIKDVRKRLTGKKTKALPKPKTPSA